MYKTLYIYIYFADITSMTAFLYTEKAKVKITWLSTDENKFLHLLGILLYTINIVAVLLHINFTHFKHSHKFKGKK